MNGGGHSYVGFSVRYMGFAKVRGRFADFSGTVRFDEKDVGATSATVKIGVESLDTDHDWRRPSRSTLLFRDVGAHG